MEGSGIALRLYRLKDLPAMHALFKEMISLEEGSWTNAPMKSLLAFRKWLSSTFQAGYLVVADEKGCAGRTVGFFGLYDIRPGRDLWFSLVVFNPGDRGKGYGGKAVELFLQFARKSGAAKKIYAEVLASNTNSLLFLKKLGFEPFGRTHRSILMQKSICSSDRAPSPEA